METKVQGRPDFRIAAAVFLAALGLYCLTAAAFGKTESPDAAYHDLLADAFLSGRMHIENPRATDDLTPHEGRWYVAFPPVPALLLLPSVALFGIEGTSTVWFSCTLGAINVLLVFLLLDALFRRRWTRLGTTGNLWLTVLFAAGSVHWYMAPSGEVWFTSQVCSVTFLAAAVLITVSRGNAWLAGLALALAMGARTHMVLAFPLLAGIAAEKLRDCEEGIPAGRWFVWCAKAAVPVIAAVLALAFYDWARFGNPLDNGYSAMSVGEPFVEDLREHGLFSPAYVLRNLRWMLLAVPRPTADGGIVPDPRGMSIFLTTPALVYLVRARSGRPFLAGAWAGVAAILVTILTYNSTGYWQFGYRYSLDFMIPVMVLLAAAAGERISWAMRGLILIGVAVNLWGVRWWY